MQFRDSLATLEAGLEHYPDHPRLLVNHAGALCRMGRFAEARTAYERIMASGISDHSIYDGLANALGHTGDTIRARLFGTMALGIKESRALSGASPAQLNHSIDPRGKKRIISFSLFGSKPRYLRGALLNLIAARDLYPGWTCRFYVDDSVDESFRNVIAEEGAELVMDDRGNADRRWKLSRRFLVNDDPGVGFFLVRDADSVIMEREAAAVAEWLDSGEPFHVMRGWFTHTDVMLAGMWGGVAGVFPDMAGAIGNFSLKVPANSNWDQHLLLALVWPAIRDDVLVHDRYFDSHRARRFPGPVPKGTVHVGQNEYSEGKTRSGELLSAYAGRIPALGISVTPLQVKFEKRF